MQQQQQQNDEKKYKFNETEIDNHDFKKLIDEYKTVDRTKWTTINEAKDGSVRVYRQQIDKKDDEIFTFKAHMKFPNVPPELVFSLACDLKTRSQWDPIYIKVKEVQRLSDEVSIMYTQLKMPTPVANRDSCLLRVVKRTDEHLMVICRSTEHPECICDKKRFVRTYTPFHAYLIEKDPSINGSTLFIISTHDPKGSIPKFVVRMVLSRSPVQWYSQLKAVCEKEILKGKSSANANTGEQFLLSRL